MRTDHVTPEASAGRPRLVDRLAFRAAYAVCILTGRAAARLADDFRELGRAGRRLYPLTMLLQLPVLACWLVVRPLSLGSFALCASLAPRLEG